MQIHEITLKNKLDEVTLPTEYLGQKARQAGTTIAQNISDMGKGLKTAAGMAAGGAKDFAGRAASIAPSADAFGALGQAFAPSREAEVQKQTADYVNKLAGEWQQAVKSIPRPQANPRPVTQPQATAQPQASAAPTRYTYNKPGTMSPELATSKTGQKMRQMYGKPKGELNDPLEEAFNDLPGANLPAGGAVSKSVTTPPRTKGQSGVWSPTYAKHFQDWAAGKLKSTIPGTSEVVGLNTVNKDPAMKKQLEALLAAVVKSRNDPMANDAAVKNYLMTAVTGLQQASAKIRATAPKVQQAPVGKGATSSLSNAQLYQLGKEIISKGERVTVPTTGSQTLDAKLKAAGLM